MIYAWYGGVRYGIQFSYERNRYGHREDTFCDIYTLGSDLNDMPPVSDDNLVGNGSAYLHEDDQFEAEVGRKIALARALENVGGYEPDLDNKEFRSAIWAAYFRRCISMYGRQKDDAGRTFEVGC